MAKISITSSVWVLEKSAWPGVRRVCDLVREDVRDVTGVLPESEQLPVSCPEAVFVGTLGRSAILDQLAKTGKLDASVLQDKWEVFSFQVVEHPFPDVGSALIIAGSDKRGTIYGLFHLSELMGVSPLKDWADVRPPHREDVILTEMDNIVSREPSVRYRGIFLNDEWPSLGTWATTHFGGFNAKMYAHVFELILRLKGNYLWPAMWKNNFSLEGPDLENARLADEFGIVMGTSHHEPCMRAGEEYGQMRGPESPYGDAWNFLTNRDGIIRFWEDGLKRNAAFENIITVGMRGEQDTPILGKDATLADNIKLLRDVLRVQNELIRRNVSSNLEDVKRLFVLFTEVESFFYGDSQTKGLQNDPELDGVTLMLSDDNFGNLRSLPTDEMLGHKGGYGLYYHLDFHGGAYAYDWMNTDYLPKMWEQLTTAWEGGIREVWIANVGDICFLEYPLSYFMDLAYDMTTYGSRAVNRTGEWTSLWVYRQFGGAYPSAQLNMIKEVLDSYTLINHNRKPEVMNVGVYHPTHYHESELLLQKTEKIRKQADYLLERCPAELKTAFWELVYYPAAASANHCRMWLSAGLNAFYAGQGRMEANEWANIVQECILEDRKLTQAYHQLDYGRFYGMALSEHIGFVWWNEDGNRYPVMMRVEGANKPRLLVADAAGDEFTIGSRWSGNTLKIDAGRRPDCDSVQIDLACGSREPVAYEAETYCPWLSLSQTHGVISGKEKLIVQIDRSKLKGTDMGTVTIHGPKTSYVEITAEHLEPSDVPEGVYVESNGVICMEAGGFVRSKTARGASWVTLKPYGRTGCGVKVLPPLADFRGNKRNRPWIEYTFLTMQEGIYHLDLYLAPSNTATMEHRLCFGLQINNGSIQEINGAGEHFRSLDLGCKEWDSNVRNNIRICKTQVSCIHGINSLRIYGGSPLLVVERIVLYPLHTVLPESYLGPSESWVRW
ncbi:MAG: glycosyl hydrolase 115 family protein [Clostridia bacterium]|nr:glycosyl hydrolase 115 family protein [Clostridia bacterium]